MGAARARRGGADRGALAALAAAALLGLGAWLARPGARAPGAARVVLVDGSASVTRVRPDWATEVAALLEGERRLAEARGETLDTFVFAAQRARLEGEAPRAPAGEEALASDLAGAVAAAARLLGDRGTLVIVDDGRATGAPVGPLLDELPRGVAVVRRRFAPARWSDLELARVRGPERVAAGAPLALELTLRCAPGQRDAGAGALPFDVLVDGRVVASSDVFALDPRGPSDPAPLEAAAGSTASEDAAELREGTLFVELGPAPAASRRLRVEVRLGDGDPIPENDARETWIRVAASPVVLVVAPDAARASAAAGELGRALPGLACSGVAPAALGRALGAADLLVALDLAPAALSGAPLEDFVRAGGGLLCAGGFDLLEAWRAEAAPPTWIALEPVPPAPTERDLWLLVDGSGSMAGASWDELRRAAPAWVALAAAGDRPPRLAFFTDVLQEPVALGRDRADATAALLAARPPRGPTDLVAALTAFEQRLLTAARAEGARPARALVCSDGRDQPPEARAALAALAQRLAALDVELVVIAAGPEPDLATLEALAGAGALRRARDEAQWLDVLRAASTRVVEGERARALRAPPSELARLPEALRALAARAEWSPPEPRRAWRARAAPDAAALWVTPGGEPLLAARDLGRGLALGWAAGPDPAFSPSPAAAWRALGPLLRVAAAQRPEGGPRLALEEGWLVVEGLAAAAPVPLVARAEGLPDLVLSPPTRALVGADALERREAPLPASWRARTGLVAVRLGDGSGPPHLLDLGGEPEFRLAAPGGFEPLQGTRPARSGSGTGDPGGGRGHPAAPWLLGVGLALAGLAAHLWGDAERADQGRLGVGR